MGGSMSRPFGNVDIYIKILDVVSFLYLISNSPILMIENSHKRDNDLHPK